MALWKGLSLTCKPRILGQKTEAQELVACYGESFSLVFTLLSLEFRNWHKFLRYAPQKWVLGQLGACFFKLWTARYVYEPGVRGVFLPYIFLYIWNFELVYLLSIQ